MYFLSCEEIKTFIIIIIEIELTTTHNFTCWLLIISTEIGFCNEKGGAGTRLGGGRPSLNPRMNHFTVAAYPCLRREF